MLPVLLDLKFIKIYTFGVFLVLGFFWSAFLLWHNIRLTSYKEEDVFDGLFLSLFGGLFIGRLVYVVLNFNDFGFDILKFILINGYPGISLIGAILGGIFTLFGFFGLKKIDFSEIIDYFISPLFVALVFGKLGSFFSGADVGSVTTFFLKIRYASFEGLRHLTAFYEAVFFAAAAYISYKLLFEIRKERLKKGILLMFFFWFFSLTYFIFDNLKERTLYLQGFSFNWLASSLMLLTTSFYFIYHFRSNIGNFINQHGTAFKKIRFFPKRKTSQREGKKPPSN